MAFKGDFVWGAASASYQIEGAAFDDGRGLSVWDVFSHTPDKTFEGETGDVACDHYNRYVEDVAIMKQIGLQAYRLSVSWPRVLPEGVGKVNQAGLDFYDKLVDELLGAGIQPYVTLFHWDYPWELYVKGGWLNRDTVNWFGEYAYLLGEKLGDRVKHWMTLNEAPVFVGSGHQHGNHAPGDKLSNRHLIRIIHHVLMSHGKAVQALRATVSDAQIGLAQNNDPAIPLVEDAIHINAARDIQWSVHPEHYVWQAATWLDPIVRGSYASDYLDLFSQYLPLQDGDMKTIQQPLDFIGLNIYQGFNVHVDGDDVQIQYGTQIGHGRTMMNWVVSPRAMYWAPKFIYERYGLPIFITENGLASTDWVAVDGAVHDAPRIDFLTRYLREFKRAAADGVDLGGYFQWSIMDNYEWALGYSRRFGLVHVDYETQERTLKDSAHWYSQVIASNGDILGVSEFS